MHLDPYFQEITLVLLVLSLFALFSKMIKIPSAIGFMLAGLIIGPSVLKIVDKSSLINQIGSAGVVLLLFFIGMEVSIKDVLKEWKVTVLGTLTQILLSVLCVYTIGKFLDWSMNRSILLGFVISLSSSAMVIKLFKDKKIGHLKTSKDAIGILVSQDILIVPMLIVLGMLGESKLDSTQISKQVIGTLLLISLVLLARKINIKKFKILNKIKEDSELATLMCLSFAFILALITGLSELSTALGAFIAGGIISQLKLSDIFHDSLAPFQTVMVAIFFSSIGLLLDLNFFYHNYLVILLLSFVALVTNTFINAIVLRILGRSWSESILTSSYLAQIGEFSFILAAIGLGHNVINEYSYQLTIYIIFITIVLTPLWVKGISKMAYKKEEI